MAEPLTAEGGEETGVPGENPRRRAPETRSCVGSRVGYSDDDIIIIIIIIINLIYIAQFDTNGILTALYIVITYIQMQYVHVCAYAEQSYKYTYTCLHIHTYTVTCTNIHLPTY